MVSDWGNPVVATDLLVIPPWAVDLFVAFSAWTMSVKYLTRNKFTANHCKRLERAPSKCPWNHTASMTLQFRLNETFTIHVSPT